jgi:hypothetical protein
MILRALGWICLVLCTLLPPSLADAEFVDVRTHLVKDRSGKKGDPKDKYFHESTFHPHYDGRFAAKQIDNNGKLSHLTALMQTFLATMNDIGAETWIMHGTLLGWWWNQRILPWDSDLDVQVDEQTIAFLAKYYNMTEYHYDIPEVNGGRTYLLEVNPHYTIPGVEDKLNVIDARWIDTDTGLFIDVSTVRANHTARALGIEGALMCKDRHHYLVPSRTGSLSPVLANICAQERDIFPLRTSTFEGMHVKIPFDYSWLLEEEYGKKALTVTRFEQHRWNETTHLWEPLPSVEIFICPVPGFCGDAG